MTKVIILGEAQGAEPEKKKIEFVKYLNTGDDNFVDARNKPSYYANIELIAKNLQSYGYDYMFAYNDDRESGLIYFGYFNDGIV